MLIKYSEMWILGNNPTEEYASMKTLNFFSDFFNHANLLDNHISKFKIDQADIKTIPLLICLWQG